MDTYKIGIYEKALPEELEIEDMIAFAAQSGYDYFEISIDRTENRISRLYSEEFALRLKKTAGQYGIGLYSVGLSAIGTYTLGNPDSSIRDRGIDIFRHALVFADKIGARIIQIPACDVPKGEMTTSDTDKRYRNTLKSMIAEAASFGILIGLENMETDYMGSVANCMALINEINSPYFQMYPDAGNITSAAKIEGIEPISDLQKCSSHCIAFHIKETKPGRYGGLFYGEGHVDFPRMISGAWNLGVRLFVLEYWYTGNPEWKNDLLKAKEMVKGILKEK